MDYVLEASELAQQYGAAGIPIEEQPSIFLSTVWATLPNSGVIGLVTDDRYPDKATGELKGTTISNWIYTEDRHDYDLAWAKRHNGDPVKIERGAGSIFWQGASRKEDILGATDPTKARGSLDQLLAVSAYWCDFDCSEQGQPLTPVVQALLSMELPPTTIYFTGGGIQAVHSFSEPWDLSDRALAKEYKSRSLAFYESLYKRVAMAADLSVHEAARMMRLPGFANRKAKRNGAVAILIYLNPGNRYPLDDIKARSVLRDKPKRKSSKKPPADTGGNIPVSHNFIRYVVRGEKIATASRHEQIVKLAYEGREVGIPREVLEERLVALAKSVWYPEESYRWTEIEQVINWAYDIAESSESGYQGNHLVEITADGIRQTHNLDFDDQRRNNLKEIPYTELPPGLELADLREEQRDAIRDYLEQPTSRLATMLAISTPPGVGKTYSALQAIKRRLRENGGQALYLTPFRVENPDRWCQDNGLDRQDVGFFIARTDDPTSAGYCGQAEKAAKIGAKGHGVYETLCLGCPLLAKCKEEHYLSQFEALKETPLVVARYQHGLMDEITKDRKTITIDESPLPLIATPIIVEITDLDIKKIEPFIQDQYPESVELVRGFLTALQAVIVSNPVQAGLYATRENVQLGGYWLLARLVGLLSSNRLESFFKLPNLIVGNVNRVESDDLAETPPRYLQDLIEIMRYEYYTYFKAGYTAWNSRLVPYNHTLRIYPMRPFSFTANTKLIVLDATSLPSLYKKCFVDRHSEDGRKKPRARELIPYNRRLKPRGRVVQITKTTFSKRTALNGRVLVNALDATRPTDELVKALDEIGNYALGQLLILTEELSRKHSKNLLIVTYKNLLTGDETDAAFYMRWLQARNLVAVDNVQYFGNLRGRNDWKNTEALLLVGTPRLQPVDVAIMAQVWYWDDPDPISLESEDREIAYPGYQENGTGRALLYRGYLDERVNEIYLNSFMSEGAQCVTRTRLYTESGDKVVYIVSDFPFAEHVDYLVSWRGKMLEAFADQFLEHNRGIHLARSKDYKRNNREPDNRPTVKSLADQFAKEQKIDGRTAWDVLSGAIYNGKSWITGESWADVYSLSADTGISEKEIVKRWLLANPEKRDLSAAKLRELVNHDSGLNVSRSTVTRAVVEVRKTLAE
jgi:hypothetical protein